MKIFAIGICLFTLCAAPITSYADDQAGVNYSAVLETAYQKFRDDNSGEVASYIPALATYDPKSFGIVLVTKDGKVFAAGDVKKKFPLESLSKVFTLSIVLNQQGAQETLKKLGANATGLPFNSALAVELNSASTQNPLVNAGAMSAVSLVQGKSSDDRWQQIISNMNAYADAKLDVNQEVYKSESETNQHNQALASLMLSYGHFYSDVSQAVDLYTRQCSVDATAEELAKMGSVLANSGKSPFNGKQLLPSKDVPSLLAEMAIAGLYDGSGKWMYEVGVPAKSGVAGGFLAVVPGKYALAVYSPPLDKAGNSVRAQEAIAYIVDSLHANLFEAKQPLH